MHAAWVRCVILGFEGVTRVCTVFDLPCCMYVSLFNHKISCFYSGIFIKYPHCSVCKTSVSFIFFIPFNVWFAFFFQISVGSILHCFVFISFCFLSYSILISLVFPCFRYFQYLLFVLLFSFTFCRLLCSSVLSSPVPFILLWFQLYVVSFIIFIFTMLYPAPPPKKASRVRFHINQLLQCLYSSKLFSLGRPRLTFHVSSILFNFV